MIDGNAVKRVFGSLQYLHCGPRFGTDDRAKEVCAATGGVPVSNLSVLARLLVTRRNDIMPSSVGHNSVAGVPKMLRFLRRQTESSRIGQIRLLTLFATLNQRELRIIDGLLHDRHYLKDEVVFDHGEEGQALYVVLSGKVLICRQGEPVTGLIAEIPAGALFGELALLDGAPRVAQARAAEDCVLAALSRADFTRLVDTHGGIASKIALQLARDLGQKLVAVNSAMEARRL